MAWGLGLDEPLLADFLPDFQAGPASGAVSNPWQIR